MPSSSAETVAPSDLLFTTVGEITDYMELAGHSVVTEVPTLTLAVWSERLKKVLKVYRSDGGQEAE